MRIDKSTLLSVKPPEHGKGQLPWFLYRHADHKGEDCLIWPYGTAEGRGVLRYDGRRTYAHRMMCEIVHGPPPSPKHQAAHSCGKGNQGCVNPRHLSWKTPSENQLDRRIHGTIGRRRNALTFEAAQRIRALAGEKTHAELAAEFGVTRGNIHHVLTGRSWTRPKRQSKRMTVT